MDYSINLSDFTQVCRVCLTAQENMTSVLTNDVIKMLEACTSRQDSFEEKFPQNICSVCYDELKISYEFKQKYIIAVRILTGILLKVETNLLENGKSEENDAQIRSFLEIKSEEIIKTDVTNSDHVEYETEDDEPLINRRKKKLERNFTSTDVRACSPLSLNIDIKDEFNDSLSPSIAESQNIPQEPEKSKPSIRRQSRKTSKTGNDIDCVCDICGKKVKKKKYLNIHKLSHSDKKPFECSLCHNTFKHSFTLTNHMKVKHTHANQRGMCFICGKLMKPKSLRYHLTTHEPVNEKFKCDICQREYLRAELLNRHIQEKHSNNSSQKYYCDICHKGYTSKICVSKHKAYMHTERKKYDCNICGKIFSHPTNVTVHVNAAHKDLRPFVCTVCSKAFHTKALLGKHMFGHTGERPHTCNICGKSFGFKNVLITHMKVHNK